MEVNLRTALIGLGRIGALPSERFKDKIPNGWLPISHIESILSTEGLQLGAVCDSNPDLLLKMGDHYKIENRFLEHQKLISTYKPDILSIATRTDVRCEIINLGLEHGVKGFYSEKPFSRSISECERTLKNITDKDAKIVYGASRRAMDIYIKAKEIIWSGELGEVVHLSAEFGRANLLWTLPHVADLFVFFLNDPQIEFVQGVCSAISKEDISSDQIDADPKIDHAFIKFASGISAGITPSEGSNLRIACSKGILTIHGNGQFIEINKAGKMGDYFHESEKITVNHARSGTQNLFEDLRNAVVKNKKVRHITPNEILKGQEILFGIAQSAIHNGILIPYKEINRELVVTGRLGHLYA